MHQMPRVDGLSPPPSAKMNCQPMGPFLVQKLNLNPGPFIIYTKSSPNVFLFLETFVTMSTWILGPGQKGKEEKENGLFTQF